MFRQKACSLLALLLLVSSAAIAQSSGGARSLSQLAGFFAQLIQRQLNIHPFGQSEPAPAQELSVLFPGLCDCSIITQE